MNGYLALSDCRGYNSELSRACMFKFDDHLLGAAAVTSGAVLVVGTVGFITLVGLKWLNIKVNEPIVVAPSTKEVSSMVSSMVSIDTAFLETTCNVGAGLLGSYLYASLIRV